MITKTYKIYSLLEAQSLITHMSGTIGNEAVINREAVYLENGGVSHIPVISGNAIRHNMARKFGMLWLIEQLEMKGKLKLSQLNYLLHGGNLTESSGSENTKIIAEMQELFPLLYLLGGSLPGQIIAGSLIASRGILICDENKKYLQNQIPIKYDIADIIFDKAEKFVTNYQYTRGDASKEFERDLNEEIPERSNLMIFNGQAIMKGSLWFHSFILQNVSEIELGAMLLSLQMWGIAGGTLGGQKAKGHGIFKQYLFFDNEINIDELIMKYVEHVNKTKEKQIEWLQKNFK